MVEHQQQHMEERLQVQRRRKAGQRSLDVLQRRVQHAGEAGLCPSHLLQMLLRQFQ
nr:hypothetical protein [Azospirillum oryzae]